jgi:hypothetical protein
MSVVEKVKSYIGVYSATDIRSLLHADHEHFRALTEEISSDAPTQTRVGAFDQCPTIHREARRTSVHEDVNGHEHNCGHAQNPA